MIRKAFLMSVKPDAHDEYQRRHAAIWPELVTTLKAHGAGNYGIFLDPRTSQLFAYVEIENQARWDAIAGTESCRKWWAYMKDIMPTNPDDSPVSRDLIEVFHLP
ncbi:L-rhamnose mutarotase [Niveibacterium terrae]|uniref:L-rhamnose mutarotase n=1 Tax=Niveibacterium terrae TaxID=3373598 RepID=UPI003A938D2F